MIGIRGTQDSQLGGQEEAFFSMLSPATQAESQLLTFDAQSGGALHIQAGSPDTYTAELFAGLNPIMKVSDWLTCAQQLCTGGMYLFLSTRHLLPVFRMSSQPTSMVDVYLDPHYSLNHRQLQVVYACEYSRRQGLVVQ